MLWIAIGQAPGAFLYAYLGTLAQRGLRMLRGQSHPRPIEYFLWIGGLLLAVVVTTLLSRLALRLLAEAEEKFHPAPAAAPTVKPAERHPEAISLEQSL
jgi:hypothetical protein